MHEAAAACAAAGALALPSQESLQVYTEEGSCICYAGGSSQCLPFLVLSRVAATAATVAAAVPCNPAWPWLWLVPRAAVQLLLGPATAVTSVTAAAAAAATAHRMLQ